MDFVQNHIDVSGKEIVDVGCGGGIYMRAFLEMGALRVTGVDFSAEMIEGAREELQEYAQVDFFLGDARQIPLPSEFCDLLLERALIHHMPAEDLLHAFSRLTAS